MGSVTYVKGQIALRNGIDLTAQNVVEQLPCEKVEVIGCEWLIPQQQGGRFTGYARRISPTKPTVDSIHAVRLSVIPHNSDVWVPIGDSSNESDWTSRCNACCGTNPAMPVITYPTPIVENTVCPVVSGGTSAYTFTATFPEDALSFNIGLSASFNGAYPTPAISAAGFATPADMLTWIQANWGAYGTWSINTLAGSVKQLQLTGATTTSAGLHLYLIAKTYSVTLPTVAGMIDTITIDGVDITFPAVSLDAANPYAALNAIAAYLDGTLTVISGGTPAKVEYEFTGLQVPTTLKLSTGGTVATFAAGAHSFTFTFAHPADVGGQNYHVTQPSFDGVVGTPDITGSAFALQSDMVTWFITNMAAYGTWSSVDGTHIKLVSGTVLAVTNLTITQS